jgi:hypothetical protein
MFIKLWSGNVEVTDLSEDLGLEGMMLIRFILKK